MPRVVVSIVTRNESRDVELLVPSLFSQTFRDFAIVATDNDSEDGTRATLAAFEKAPPVPLTVIPSRENLGFTGGHNGAIARAAALGAEWVLVLNADVVLAPDFLERLLEDLSRPGRERVGAATGKILRADGPDLAPTDLLDTVGIRMTRNGRHFDIGSGEKDTGRYDRPAEVFGVSGCVALYRVAALEDVKIPASAFRRRNEPAGAEGADGGRAPVGGNAGAGYFDEDFFVYREDVELSWRLRGRGWTARCVPAARAWHRRRNLPERRREMSRLANLHSVKNRFLLRVNNAGALHLRATFAPTFVRDLLVVGGCLTVERSSLEALRYLARERRRLLAKRAGIQERRTVPDEALLRWFTPDPDGARIPDA